MTQHIITVPGPSEPWQRSAIYDDVDGEIYLPIVAVKRRQGLFYQAITDRIRTTILDGNVFYPMGWLKRHQSEDKDFIKLCDIIETVVKKQTAAQVD